MASEERRLRHLRREVEELERRLDGSGGRRSGGDGDSGAGGDEGSDLTEETVTETIGEQGMAPGIRRRPDARDRTTEEVEQQRREREEG